MLKVGEAEPLGPNPSVARSLVRVEPFQTGCLGAAQKYVFRAHVAMGHPVLRQKAGANEAAAYKEGGGGGGGARVVTI